MEEVRTAMVFLWKNRFSYLPQIGKGLVAQMASLRKTVSPWS
jgi:hypothetical protein